MDDQRRVIVERESHDCAFTETVERACHLAATSDDIASVTVVPGRRSRCGQSYLFKESVALLPLELELRADGSVAVRKVSVAETPPERANASIRKLRASERRAVARIEHFYTGLVRWNAGFNGLVEGLR